MMVQAYIDIKKSAMKKASSMALLHTVTIGLDLPVCQSRTFNFIGWTKLADAVIHSRQFSPEMTA